MVLTLVDLGEDLLLSQVCQRLDVEDILALSRTSKALRGMLDTNVAYHLIYHKAFGSYGPFGIESHDWKELYRIHSSNRVGLYTWGFAGNGRLGYLVKDVNRGLHAQSTLGVCHPHKLPNFDGSSVRAIKAGGFGFQILTSAGVYSTGASSTFLHRSSPPGPRNKDVAAVQVPSIDCDVYESKFVSKMLFPKSRDIVALSSGRRHFVALDDQGKILSWDTGSEEWERGVYLHFGTLADHFLSVKAGWNSTACYSPRIGVVVVHARENISSELNESRWPESDAIYSIIPSSCNVVDFVALNNCVLFIDKEGCLKEYRFGDEPDYIGVVEVLEEFEKWLLQRSRSSSASVNYTKIVGFFQTFAVFVDDGSVLIGMKNGSKWSVIIRPEIQNRSIIDMAVGDYHFLAITSNGDLLSWGLESRCNGCLGLGPPLSSGTGTDAIFREGVDARAPSPIVVEKPTEKGRWIAVCAAGWHSGALYFDDT